MVQTGRKLNVCVHLLYAHFICFYKCVCIHVCAYLYMEIYMETSISRERLGDLSTTWPQF